MVKYLTPCRKLRRIRISAHFMYLLGILIAVVSDWHIIFCHREKYVLGGIIIRYISCLYKLLFHFSQFYTLQKYEKIPLYKKKLYFCTLQTNLKRICILSLPP